MPIVAPVAICAGTPVVCSALASGAGEHRERCNGAESGINDTQLAAQAAAAAAEAASAFAAAAADRLPASWWPGAPVEVEGGSVAAVRAAAAAAAIAASGGTPEEVEAAALLAAEPAMGEMPPLCAATNHPRLVFTF